MKQAILANLQKWYGYPLIARDISTPLENHTDTNITIEVDMVIISWAKTDKLKTTTEDGIRTCIESDPSIKFNFYVVETNPDVSYDYPNVTMIYPKVKYGYHRYLNLGRKAGRSKYVCLCNNDLTYESSWATNIINLMETYSDIRSVSPWNPATHRENTKHIGTTYLGWHIRGEVLGQCIFQQRDIYETIGDLDEQFEFWFCDDDYALTLSQKKILHALLPSSVVHHDEQLTELLEDEDKYRLTYGQLEVYTKKWSALIPTLSDINVYSKPRAHHSQCAYHRYTWLDFILIAEGDGVVTSPPLI